MNTKKASVLIVGAGPTGLVLALWLGKLGVSVRIIDKNEGPGETSRALAVQARTLEFYRQIGIADELIAAGIKMEYFILNKQGKELKKVRLGDIGEGLSPYPFVLSFPQDDHERLLLIQLQKIGIFVERRTELYALTQDSTKVTATLKFANEEQVMDFDYVCGCDGARSTTRDLVKITFPGSTYSNMFYVADVATTDTVVDGIQIGVSKKDFCVAFPVRSSHSLRLIGIVPKEHEQKKDIQFADVQESVRHNIKVGVENVNWFSTYHVHHRVVPQFSVGRIFLAGDAAHIHSPVGGQGMNTGIGDAINLAWKLAAVLQNKSSEKILGTYQSERLPFAQKLVATTDKLFQIITSGSWAGAAWRNVVFPYVFPFMFKHKITSQLFFKFISQIKISYPQSPLSIKNQGALRAGDRLPWVKNGAHNNFDALKTLAWQVHIYGTAHTSLRNALKQQDIQLDEFPWCEAAKKQHLLENAVYLIRPDGYISLIEQNTDNAQQIIQSVQQVIKCNNP